MGTHKAHARRKLFDEFERTKSPIAEEALKRIGKLYDIEADITGFDAELRQKARKDLAVPILVKSRPTVTPFSRPMLTPRVL